MESRGFFFFNTYFKTPEFLFFDTFLSLPIFSCAGSVLLPGRLIVMASRVAEHGLEAARDVQIPSAWWDARTEFTVGVTCQARAA